MKDTNFFKKNGQAGQASRLLLVLAVVILVAVIIVYLVMQMANKPSKPSGIDNQPTVPLPVYEQTINDVRFVFESARDLGDILTPSQAKNTNYSNQKSLTTSEKFIEVTIGAQNKGTENITQNFWDIENIVDSEGRNFVPLGHEANPWLPEKDLCGVLLKPAFDPIPCVKIYEVSKEATGLKIRVKAGKKDEALIDLIVK